jgi:transcriptional regulator with XRE-family HTH domain
VATGRKPADIGAERGRILLEALIREVVIARRDRGLSLAEVGRAVGITGSMVSRIEGRHTEDVGLIRVAAMLSVVGLELSARAFPGGNPVRDAAHGDLLARFAARLDGTLGWRLEVPVPVRGDL